MEQRFPAGSEAEPVSYTQLRDYIGGYTGAISVELQKKALELGYSENEIKPTIDNLKQRTALFRNGLKTDLNYSFLKPQVENWFGMALAVVQSSTIETSKSALQKSLEAIQGVMVVNGAFTDEALVQLQSLKDETSSSPQSDPDV